MLQNSLDAMIIDHQELDTELDLINSRPTFLSGIYYWMSILLYSMQEYQLQAGTIETHQHIYARVYIEPCRLKFPPDLDWIS